MLQISSMREPWLKSKVQTFAFSKCRRTEQNPSLEEEQILSKQKKASVELGNVNHFRKARRFLL